MTSTNSRQMTAGKSFEYAILMSFEEKLGNKTNIKITKPNTPTDTTGSMHLLSIRLFDY